MVERTEILVLVMSLPVLSMPATAEKTAKSNAFVPLPPGGECFAASD